jgi:hypothetical protein
MMLGLWIILMFGSGMPGLYIYGIVWLVVVDVTDRWYITKMCKQPVRYGQSLPFLLLGEQAMHIQTHTGRLCIFKFASGLADVCRIARQVP